MSFDVALSELAVADLVELHQWIAAEADQAIADRFIGRINTVFEALSDFPNRGSPRDDFGRGVRTITFERRIIMYRVSGAQVLVLRVVHGARDLTGLVPH
jgi:toxin ParE1/3/4